MTAPVTVGRGWTPVGRFHELEPSRDRVRVVIQVWHYTGAGTRHLAEDCPRDGSDPWLCPLPRSRSSEVGS